MNRGHVDKYYAKQMLSNSRHGMLTSIEVERVLLCIINTTKDVASDSLLDCIKWKTKKILGMSRDKNLTERDIMVIFQTIKQYEL